MMRFLKASAACLVSVLIAMPLLTTPVRAEAICGERADFLKHLGANHAEAPSAMGLGSNGSVVELLTATSGSWTLIFTMADGNTCLLATGEAWETVAPKVALGPKA